MTFKLKLLIYELFTFQKKVKNAIKINYSSVFFSSVITAISQSFLTCFGTIDLMVVLTIDLIISLVIDSAILMTLDIAIGLSK